MKRIFPLLLALAVCLALAVPAGAVEDPSVAEKTEADELTDAPIRVELTLASADTDPGIAPHITGEEIVVGTEVLDSILGVLGLIESNTQDDTNICVPAVSSSSDLVLPDDADRPGLAGTMVSIFGEYTPLTYQVDTYLDDELIASGLQVVPGLAGMDWPWIGGVSLFAIMLFSFFKILGGVWR